MSEGLIEVEHAALLPLAPEALYDKAGQDDDGLGEAFLQALRLSQRRDLRPAAAVRIGLDRV